MRKLPFNNGGNYNDAAERFLIREHSEKAFLPEIVNWLRTHSLPTKTRDWEADLV